MQQGHKVLIMGGIIMDQYLLLDRYPARGQDILIQEHFQRVGGCAVNVASTLQNLGCEPYLVSTVGSDRVGQDISRYLKANCFPTRCLRLAPEARSGYCLALVEQSGERTFLTYKGCEGLFSAAMIPADLSGDIKYVYLTGYYLLEPSCSAEVLLALQQLKKAGSKLMFDPGPLVEEIEDSLLLSVLQLTDVAVPNEVEAEKIGRKLKLQGSFHQWSLAQGMELVVVKMGSRGVQVWGRDLHYATTPYQVTSIDTTGAGDSFAGGLIYGLLQHCGIEAAVEIANACGAITTTMMGPHGKFGLEDVMAIIRDGKETQ